MTRDDQIEALARRMAWAIAGPVELSRSVAIAFATIAIELAEAAREEAAYQAEWWADESVPERIRAMTLPIETVTQRKRRENQV